MQTTLPISHTVAFSDGTYGVMYASSTYGEVLVAVLLLLLVSIEAVRLWKEGLIRR